MEQDGRDVVESTDQDTKAAIKGTLITSHMPLCNVKRLFVLRL